MIGYILTLVTLILSGCSDNFMKASVKDQSTLANELSTTKDAAGNYSAALDPGAKTTQTMRASSGSVAGSAIAMPSGALSIAVNVTIGEGASLASSSVTQQIGLSGNPTTAAGPAVSFVPSSSVEATSPFTLSIPIQASSSLALNEATFDTDNLVIIYNWMSVVNGVPTYSVGLLTRKDLTVGAKAVQFQTTKFGTFQLAVTKTKVTQKIEVPTIEPPVLKSEQPVVAVVLAPASLTYSVSTATYVRGVAIAPNVPSLSGGTPTSFTVAPALPSGIVLDAVTGIITGTATVQATITTYTITASNSSGSTSTNIVFAVTASTVPSVTLTSTATNPTGTSPILMMANFSEDVTDFLITDITVGNGAANTLTGSGANYTFLVTPTSNGSVTVDIAAGVANGAYGTVNTAATQFAVTYSNVNPSVTLTSAAPATVNGMFSVTATFSESVTGFISTSVAVTNGTVSNFTVSSGTTYTFDVTPTANSTVSVNVEDGVAFNEANNPNTASTSLTRVHDSVAPTVSSVGSNIADGSYKVGESIGVLVTFSEAVTVNGSPRIGLNTGSGGEAIYLNGSGSPTLLFTYVVAANQNSTDLDYNSISSLTLNGGTIRDAAGNSTTLTLPTPGGTNSLGGVKAIIIDTAGPVVSSITLSGSSPSSSVTQVWNVIFNEPVTGFTDADVIPTSGITASNITVTPLSSSSYTITMVLTLTSANEGASIFPRILAGAVHDSTGNGNGTFNGTGATVEYRRAIDITAVQSVLPSQPYLTLRPSVGFTIDYPADNVSIYRDSTCSAASYSTGAQSAGAITITLSANLPTSGVHSLFAKATRNSNIHSACTAIGSYTTGISKVMVATADHTNGTGDWACAIANGGLKCWGSNNSGQLGVGTTPATSAVPVEVFPPNSLVTDVAMSIDRQASTYEANSTCVVVDGNVRCWGKNSFGQLGNNSTTHSSTPVQVLTVGPTLLTGVKSIYGSTGRFCALKNDGYLYCWGKNFNGAVGVGVPGTTTMILLAKQVFGIYNQVAMGDVYSCGVTTSGAAMCWGFNENGKLGDGTSSDRHAATQVSGLTSGVVRISTDAKSTCAVMSDGTAKCWGWNGNGELGDGTTTTRLVPGAVLSLSGVVDVLSGATAYAALTSGTTFKSWGRGVNGEIFDGTVTSKNVPTDPVTPSVLPNSYILSGFGWSSAAGSKDVICPIINGGVMCRGHDTIANALGIGSVAGFVVPANSNVTSVSASKNFSCAVLANSSVQCWGKNNIGQLGRSSTSASELTPAAVGSLL
jgi:alpha-tubulin suppressor-like RCC1 family protein